MVKKFQDGKLPFMKSCTEIIEAVNKMVNGEDKSEKIFVTVREIIKSVKEGKIGCEPPKQVRTSKLPEGAFNYFSDLFFSFAVISQANSEKVLKRTTLISIIDTILTPYFKSKGEESKGSHSLASYDFYLFN
jgi:hypothetical protein